MRQRMPGDRSYGRPARGHDDEHGFTSVELIVAMSIMALIMVITLPIVSTVFAVSNGVKASYATVNQVLPATTVLERLIRSAASPTPALGFDSTTEQWVPQNPTVGGIPTPPFAPRTLPVQSSPPEYQTPSNGPFVMSANSMSFYSNTGDPNGPEYIQATTTAIAGSTSYRFKVTATPATAGSCPTARRRAALIEHPPPAPTTRPGLIDSPPPPPPPPPSASPPPPPTHTRRL
jgi:type II secretory pathway pseudopilin PulG